MNLCVRAGIFLLAVFWAVQAKAHTLADVTGVSDAAISKYAVTCFNDGGGDTSKYAFRIKFTSPLTLGLSLSVNKAGQSTNVVVDALKSGSFSAWSYNQGGNGEYILTVTKIKTGESAVGKVPFTIEHHCMTANGGHAGTSDAINISPPDPDPQQILNVTTSGFGTVTSSPAGINCGRTCTGYFSEGSTVSLFAAPATHYTFGGWFGEGCSGTEGCVVTMNAARNVSAVFIPPEKPSVPSEVTPTAGNAKATVSWKASRGIVDGYRVDAYDSNATNPPSVGSCEAKPPSTSCEVANLNNGALYRFRVTAYGPGGTSEPSGFSAWVVPGSPPVNAQCGTANGVLTNDPPSHVDLCLAGHATSSEQDAAKVFSWTCVGVGGGASIDCRTGGPLPVYPEPTARLFVTLKTKNSQFKSGILKSDPIGVDCGTRCGYSFTKGSKITLSVTPQDGAKFNGWSGACAHKKLTCSFTLRKDRQVTAKFK
jgi:hypothetical protein